MERRRLRFIFSAGSILLGFAAVITWWFHQSHPQVFPRSAVQSPPVDTATNGERRCALVIGNSAYADAPLRNPVNDATAMEELLQRLDFSVIVVTDATEKVMREKIEEFSEVLAGCDVGLFYFAGHGVQMDGKNYLIPIDSTIDTPSDITDQKKTIAAASIMQTMEKAGKREGSRNTNNILIFDACRENPWQFQEPGLAAVEPEQKGILIALATSPGQVAVDGVGLHSPYTTHLLQQLQQPHRIEEVLSDVGIKVLEDTQGKQHPGMWARLTKRFVFAPECSRRINLRQPDGASQNPCTTHSPPAEVSSTAQEPQSAEDQFRLGKRYETRDGMPQDFAEAARWYRKAAKQRHPAAQYALGTMYLEPRGVTKDERQAAAWFREAAEQGHALAQTALAKMYEAGQGQLLKDDTEAVRWYRKAAEQGEAEAQNNLGVRYRKGISGVQHDDRQAVEWYRKAAEQGYMFAQHNLGWMYEHGNGVAKDTLQAAAWYRKAADQGYVGSQLNLGLLYKYGRSEVPKDARQAEKWLIKAVAQGDASAKYNLAEMYEGGSGIAKNETLAFQLYLAATNNGNVAAAYKLGVMYEHGRGVPQNRQQAIIFYMLAEAHGHAEAKKAVTRLKDARLAEILHRSATEYERMARDGKRIQNAQVKQWKEQREREREEQAVIEKQQEENRRGQQNWQ